MLICMNGLNDRSFSGNRDLKQQRQRQLWERHLKSEFAQLETLSRSFHLVQFVKCWQIFLKLNSYRLYRSSGKEKESRCLLFTPSTKREIRHFHVVIVQWRREMYKKAWCTCEIVVLLIQTGHFFPFSLPSPSPSSLFKLPNMSYYEAFTRLENKQGKEHTSLVHQESISPSTLFFSAHFLT